MVDCVWMVMGHAQKPYFVFRRNGRVHLNRRGRQFSRLLAAEVCVSAVVMLDTPCTEVVWRVLATHSIGQFPLHFPSRASPCAITFQLQSTYWYHRALKLQLTALSGQFIYGVFVCICDDRWCCCGNVQHLILQSTGFWSGCIYVGWHGRFGRSVQHQHSHIRTRSFTFDNTGLFITPWKLADATEWRQKWLHLSTRRLSGSLQRRAKVTQSKLATKVDRTYRKRRWRVNAVATPVPGFNPVRLFLLGVCEGHCLCASTPR